MNSSRVERQRETQKKKLQVSLEELLQQQQQQQRWLVRANQKTKNWFYANFNVTSLVCGERGEATINDC